MMMQDRAKRIMIYRGLGEETLNFHDLDKGGSHSTNYATYFSEVSALLFSLTVYVPIRSNLR